MKLKWLKIRRYLYWHFYLRKRARIYHEENAMWPMQESIEYLVRYGFIESDLKPLICTNCGSREFKEIPKNFINSTVCEFSVECSKCTTQLGYWSYGSYMP